MPAAGRMLYGSAKPCGFSIAKVTFLGHARAVRSHQSPFKGSAGALERAAPGLFRPMVPDFLHGAPPTGACVAFIKESRMKFVNARELDRKSGCTPWRTWGTRPGNGAWLANRKNRAAPRSGMKSIPFFLLRCGANLNKASDTVFSPSVGSKPILLVEARWEMAT
jgi:hypothetical protein